MLGVQWMMEICFCRFNAFSYSFHLEIWHKVLAHKILCLPMVLGPIDFHGILVDPIEPEMVWLPTFTRSNAIEEPV